MNAETMDIELRCYGRVKQALGDRRLAVTLEDAATVGDLLDTLEDRYEAFDRDALSGPAGLIVMRDRRHLGVDAELGAGDVVSLSDSPMVES